MLVSLFIARLTSQGTYSIAYRNCWISEEKMRELVKPMQKNQYGQYLLKVIDEMKEEINSNTFTHPEMSEIKK